MRLSLFKFISGDENRKKVNIYLFIYLLVETFPTGSDFLF